jgi:hypothetical protein
MKLFIALYCLIKNINVITNIDLVKNYYKRKKCNTLKEINEYIFNNFNIYILLKNQKLKLLNKFKNEDKKNILLSRTRNDYFLLFNDKNKLIRFITDNKIKGGKITTKDSHKQLHPLTIQQKPQLPRLDIQKKRLLPPLKNQPKLQLPPLKFQPKRLLPPLKTQTKPLLNQILPNIDDKNFSCISFYSLKMNFLLNELENPKSYVKHSFHYYLSKIKERTRKIRKIKIKVKEIIKNKKEKDEIKKKIIKSAIFGGGNMTDFCKTLLKTLHIYDKKHDFAKPRNGEKLSSQNFEILYNSSIKFIDDLKTADDSNDKTKFLKELKELYEYNKNYETNILIYIIEKLMNGSFFEDNITSLFAFYVIKENKFVNAKNNDLLQLNGNITELYEQLKNFIENFLELSSISKKYYLLDTIIKVRSSDKDDDEVPVAPVIAAVATTDDIEMEDIDIDLNDGDMDIDVVNEDMEIEIIDNEASIRWSDFTKNVLDKTFEKIVPIESRFDPNSSGPIKIPPEINKNEITNLVYNESRTNENESAFRELTKKYFEIAYYETPTEGLWVSLKLKKEFKFERKPQNKLLIEGFEFNETNSDIRLLFNDSNEKIIQIAWNDVGFSVPILMKYINLLKSKQDIREKKESKANNIVLQIIILYLHQNSVDIDNIIEILYDFKKSGDWGQVLYCKHSNEKNTNSTTLFVSGDKLCSVYSLLQQSVKTLFGIDHKFLDKTIRDKSFIIGVYKSNTSLSLQDILLNIITIFKLRPIFFNHEIIIGSKSYKIEILSTNKIEELLKNIPIFIEILYFIKIKILEIKEDFFKSLDINLKEKLYESVIIKNYIEFYFTNKILFLLDLIIRNISSTFDVKEIIILFKNLNNLFYTFDNIHELIKAFFYKNDPDGKETFLEKVLKQLNQNLQEITIPDKVVFNQKATVYKDEFFANKKSSLDNIIKKNKSKLENIKSKIDKIQKSIRIKDPKNKINFLEKQSQKLSAKINEFEKKLYELSKEIEETETDDKATYKTPDKKRKAESISNSGDIIKQARYTKSEGDTPRRSPIITSVQSENSRVRSSPRDRFKKSIDKLSAISNTVYTFTQIKEKLNENGEQTEQFEKLFESFYSDFIRGNGKTNIPLKNFIYIKIIDEILNKLLLNIEGYVKQKLDKFIDNIDLLYKSDNEIDKNFITFLKEYSNSLVELNLKGDLYTRYLSNIKDILQKHQIAKTNIKRYIEVKFYYEHIFKLLCS